MDPYCSKYQKANLIPLPSDMSWTKWLVWPTKCDRSSSLGFVNQVINSLSTLTWISWNSYSRNAPFWNLAAMLWEAKDTWKTTERTMLARSQLFQSYQPRHQIYEWRSHLRHSSPADTTWKRTQTWDLWPQSSCPWHLQPFSSQCSLGPRHWEAKTNHCFCTLPKLLATESWT